MEERTIQILKKYSQEHLIKYLSTLTKSEQQVIEEQILKIDFESLQKLYKGTKQKEQVEEQKLEHIPYVDKEKLTQKQKEKLEEIRKKNYF